MIGTLASKAADALPGWLLTVLLLALAAGLGYVALALTKRQKVAAISAVL